MMVIGDDIDDDQFGFMNDYQSSIHLNCQHIDKDQQCTMLLSQCKWVSQEFEYEYLYCPHFLAIQLFQRKYLGYL